MMGKPSSRAAEVRVAGPLAPYAVGFRDVLREKGYTPLSAVNQMRLMAHLSGWLEMCNLSCADLTEQRVTQYLDSRRAAGRSQYWTRRSLASLLGFLAAQRVSPIEETGASASKSQVLVSFEHYLLSERGLRGSTAAAYVRYAGRFLDGYIADGDLSGLTVAEVIAAVRAEGVDHSVGAVQYFVVALRAFLRYCHVEGLLGADLSAAAQTVTGRHRSLLPLGIGEADAVRLLRACDRRTATGRRDHAAMLLMLRLGLRAGEVAALGLLDIDWNAGEVTIHGKGRREDRLPLPVDVGEAIVAYLRRGRPATAMREVFVTVTAPTRGLTREAVAGIIRRACVRAGLDEVGAHRLRHTTACAMVAHGAPLVEIGQLLRHRSPTSTANYARVDVDRLTELARPWPTRREGTLR
jgi:site-specific recombinase XerD